MHIVSIHSDTDGVLDVVLCGELDFTNASRVAADVRESIDHRRPSAVRVDLAAVTFLDSSGIGLLVQAMRAAREVSADFRVEGPTENVFDQLRCTGLLEAFGLTEPGAGPDVIRTG
jgi:anti-sigma B factor antagonist